MIDKVKNVINDILNNVEKKYLIMGGVGILLLIIMMVSTSCNKKQPVVVDSKATYEAIKEKMVASAKKYYEENPIYLPKEGKKADLTISTLVNNLYLPKISSLVPSGVECDGKVVVRRSDKIYSYVAFLDCGENFSEMGLLDVIEDNNEIVTTGSGLYKIGDERIFRGEPQNNYINIENNLWRIFKIDKENTIYIIFEGVIVEDKIEINGIFQSDYVWDNRFNVEKMDTSGINDFEVSRIKESILSLENNTNIIPEKLKEKLIKKNLCIGKRELSESSTSKDNSIECATLSQNKFYIGSITPSDYMIISLDENCTNNIIAACSNYNFLTKYKKQYWFFNALPNNTYDVMYAGGLNISYTKAENKKAIRPMIYLSDSIIRLSGSGTLSDPYIIQ